MLWSGLLLLVVLVPVAFVLGRKSGRRAATRAWTAGATRTIDHLHASNALLRTLASAQDIAGSLFELATKIHALVACDRVGLALLNEDGQGYRTFTARLDSEGRDSDPMPDLHFPRGSTIIDEVVTAREGRIVGDVTALAPTHLDANVLSASGFASCLVVPLVYEDEAFGTINLVARRPGAFSPTDLQAMRPVAEILAIAYRTRRMANALARHQIGNELSELTFAFANDMNGAVQAIIGQSELLARQLRDPAMTHEFNAVIQQARRLREILNTMQRMTREHVATTRRPQ